jgi:AraC-like DNA-binding protein
VGPGQVFILRKGVDHTYKTGPRGRAHKRILAIDGSMLQQALMQSGLWNQDVIRLKDARTFAGFIKQAMRIHQERKPHFMRRLSELAYAVLLFLEDEHKGPRYPLPVQRAIDYMYQNLGKSLSLQEISGAAATSVPHLCRLFRQYASKAPKTFFRWLKVQHAKNLLLGTTARIEEIAFQLGYEDVAQFSHMFAKEAGMPPREFRKKPR